MTTGQPCKAFRDPDKHLFSQVSAVGRVLVCHQEKVNTEGLPETSTQKTETHLLVPGLTVVGFVPSYLEGQGLLTELPIG